MANTIKYKEAEFSIGDTITVNYKIKEGDKFRIQPFKGIVLKIKGDSEDNRMVTVRKISNIGLGVERIFPLAVANIESIKVDRKSDYRKARLNFIRDLNESQVRKKLYSKK